MDAMLRRQHFILVLSSELSGVKYEILAGTVAGVLVLAIILVVIAWNFKLELRLLMKNKFGQFALSGKKCSLYFQKNCFFVIQLVNFWILFQTK